MLESLLQPIKERLRVYSNYVLIGIIIFLIVSLTRNILRILQAQDRISQKQEELTELQDKNEQLRERLERVSSDEYAEKQLRDKLGLAKEGEMVIVLPDEETLKKLAPELDKEEERLPDPNWKKWIELFN